MNLGTVFERLGTLKELEMQYPQALAKPKARNYFSEFEKNIAAKWQANRREIAS